MTGLKALILNDNKLESLQGIGVLVKLNSLGKWIIFLPHISKVIILFDLVLSHNEIDELTGLGKMTDLRKLTISHNKIKVIPPLMKNLISLTDFKMNSN